jgi:hypothetical protein
MSGENSAAHWCKNVVNEVQHDNPLRPLAAPALPNTMLSQTAGMTTQYASTQSQYTPMTSNATQVSQTAAQVRLNFDFHSYIIILISHCEYLSQDAYTQQYYYNYYNRYVI